jgi:flagellar basal-body rod protein FlgC
MLRAIDISTTGLIAQRQRMNTIAGNIANSHTTRDADGNLSPFQRRLVTFHAESTDPASAQRGVGVTYNIEIDHETKPRLVHDPGHPDADENGFVSYPGLSLVTEFVNAADANRAYEANIAAIDISKSMVQSSLRILA